MNIKNMVCYLKAIPFFVKMGFKKEYFIPHVFEDVEEFKANIFYDKKKDKIRLADTYTHTFDERYYPNAIVTGIQCKYCGYKTATFRTERYMGDISEDELKSIMSEDDED